MAGQVTRRRAVPRAGGVGAGLGKVVELFRVHFGKLGSFHAALQEFYGGGGAFPGVSPTTEGDNQVVQLDFRFSEYCHVTHVASAFTGGLAGYRVRVTNRREGAVKRPTGG